MEIISANFAKEISIDARKKKIDFSFRKILSAFNVKVEEESSKGKMSCYFLWRDLLIDPVFFYEDSSVETIVNEILEAGYTMEFIYDGITSSEPCGFAVSWCSNNSEQELQNLVENARENGKDIYRSDE